MTSDPNSSLIVSFWDSTNGDKDQISYTRRDDEGEIPLFGDLFSIDTVLKIEPLVCIGLPEKKPLI